MPKVAKYLAGGLVLVLIGIGSIWAVSRSWTFSLIGSLVNRVETNQPLVALTFDDGPTPGFTEKILAVLDRHHAKATFFVIGEELDRNIELGRKIVAAGHELGNHTYTHKGMIFKTPSFVREEIAKTDAAIRKTGFAGPIHFRPPYSKKFLVLPYILKEQGRLDIFMDLAPDSLSEIENDRNKITEYVLSNVQAGSIILMHVMYSGRSESIAAVPAILEGLEKKGLKPVTVSELLSAGKPTGSRVHLANEIHGKANAL